MDTDKVSAEVRAKAESDRPCEAAADTDTFKSAIIGQVLQVFLNPSVNHGLLSFFNFILFTGQYSLYIFPNMLYLIIAYF